MSLGGGWRFAVGGPVQELPEPVHEPDEAKALAEEILARPEYQEPGESLIERVARAVGDFFDDLFGGVGGPAGGGSGSLLAWLVVLGLAGLVAFFLVRMLSSGRWGAGRRLGGAGEAVVAETDRDLTADDWEARATEHEAAGRWREAILCRYRALVVTLGDRGVVSKVAGRTAGDHAREVAAEVPAAADAFAGATEMFEDVRYGGAEAGSGERDRFVGLVEETSAAVDRAERRAPTTPVEVGS